MGNYILGFSTPHLLGKVLKLPAFIGGWGRGEKRRKNKKKKKPNLAHI